METSYKSRSTTYSNNGMVCSTSPLAASAGMNVLANGGNAFDAAITVASVEAVTVPGMCGFGGEVFAIYHDASSGRTRGLTSTGIAPKKATISYFKSRGYDFIPADGPLAVSPPGEFAAYDYLNKTYGKIPLSSLIGPAIHFAEKGHPLASSTARLLVVGKDKIYNSPSLSKLFLKQDGSLYTEGEIFKNTDLANTLRRVAEKGTEDFYKGEIANSIIERFKEAGGILDRESLETHMVEEYEPLTTNYRGYVVAENRPPSQGMLLLQMLNIMELFDLGKYGHLNAKTIHLMVEAKKLAFADRNDYLGDPLSVEIPIEQLLSKSFAKARKESIDTLKSSNSVASGNLINEGTDTSYFCVADKAGNAVSFIHSLYNSFGSGFVADGTGILFNNRQQGFRLEDGHPNSLQPGKRPMHTLNAFIVLQTGKPVIISGTPGADFQTQGNLQLITSLIDHGLSPQEAVDAPRWNSMPGSHPPTRGDPFELRMEPRVPANIALQLERMGHKITWGQEGISHGIFQLICVDPHSGVLAGASDPRGDGHVAAL
jgi:gamma-glutamyltranspeptidase/glutathione hydrolase